jgi:hypothetical protein
MVTFNFTYSPGVTIQQALGFEIAGRIWSHYFNDPVTLNIHIGMGGITQNNVIGGALPGIVPNQSYSTVRSRFVADAETTTDQSALLSLPNTSTKAARYEVVYNGTPHMMPTQISTLNLTRANAKALGMIAGNNAALDGLIVMSDLSNLSVATSWSYNYSRSNSNASNTLDFLSVALHELGHVLGFVSGVDLPGLPNNVFTGSQSVTDATPIQQLVPSTFRQAVTRRASFATPMDLFRTNVRDGAMDVGGDAVLSSSSDPRFSISNGTSTVGETARGKEGTYRDGFQASHWERDTQTGDAIMVPNLARQERLGVTSEDWRALDILGWDLRSTTSVSYTTLHDQAISALATRLGQTTTWVRNNLTLSPSTLVRNRDLDVAAMVVNSVIYQWGTSGSGSTSPPPRRWMEVFNQLANNQTVYVNFSRFLATDKTSPTVKEDSDGMSASPDPILGVSEEAPLVGDGLGDRPSFGAAPAPVDIASLAPNQAEYKGWQPISTFGSGAIATDQPFSLGTINGSDVQGLDQLNPLLNALLGLDNSPLAHSTLTATLTAKVA